MLPVYSRSTFGRTLVYQYDREYKTARAVYTWLEFVGWATIVLGGLFALVGLSTGGTMGLMVDSRDLPFGFRILAALPGVGTAIGGLFAVAYVQTSRSHVDVAEMSREMLEIARRSTGQSAGAQLPIANESIVSDKKKPPEENRPLVEDYNYNYRGFRIGNNDVIY